MNLAIVTTLLREQGVRQAVVCAGSRNAAIVNNLVAMPGIECHAATDERSAAFEAMGMSMATGCPAVVCVTSGSALLNTMPAVAEAWYQHVPLVVVSADRPSAWIGQIDGQTIDQPGAMSRWCCMSVSLPEVKDETERWECNWLVNKALVTAIKRKRPVHINVPLSEPLYEFGLRELPEERVVRIRTEEEMAEAMGRRKRVMVVVGQKREMPSLEDVSRSCAVVAEPLAWCGTWADGERLAEGMEEPEMVIYLGGTIVSKGVKEYLRRCGDAEVWYVSDDGEMADTFMNLRNVVFTDNINNVVKRMEGMEKEYAKRWSEMQGEMPESRSEEEEVVRRLEKRIEGMECNVCYANSMAVRYGCRYARHNVFCNRGVNGIEGSVSTAVGVARGSGKMCICVTGDLSMLYDGNALWRPELPGNLKIVVMNNGGGKIFERFKALEGNEAKAYVTGEHEVTCRGMCEGYGVEYRGAGIDGVDEGIEWLMGGEGVRVLEIIIKQKI